MAGVSPLPYPAALTTALALANSFRAQTSSTSAFPQFTKQVILDGITDRITKPSDIDQAYTSLCGPSAFYYTLTRNRPDLFVRAAIDLYVTGKAKLGNLSINPSQSMKSYSLPSNAAMNPVDWIILASLRDSQNSIFNYDEISDEIGGITYPGDIISWYDKVGFKTTNNASVTGTAGIENLLRAHETRRNHQSVSLLIDAKIIQASSYRKGQMAMFPNHWVVLSSDVFIDSMLLNGGLALQLKTERENSQNEDVGDFDDIGKDFVHNVSFNVYSWGTTTQKLGGRTGTGSIDLETFLNNYFGFVSVAF